MKREKKERKKDSRSKRTKGQEKLNIRRLWFSAWWPVLLVVVLFLAVGTSFVYQVQNVMDQELLTTYTDTNVQELEQIRENYEQKAQVNPEAAYEYAMAALEWHVNMGYYSELGVSLCNSRGEVVAERGRPTLYLEYPGNPDAGDSISYYYRSDPDMEQQVMEVYAECVQQPDFEVFPPRVRIDEAYIGNNVCYPIRVNIYSSSREMAGEDITVTYHLKETVTAEKDQIPEDALHLTNLDLIQNGSNINITEEIARTADARKAGTYYITHIYMPDENLPKMSETIRKYLFSDTDIDALDEGGNYENYISSQCVVWDEDNQVYDAVVMPIYLGSESYYFILLHQQKRNGIVDSYVALGWIIGILFSALIALAITRGFVRTMRKEQELVRRQREYTNALAHDLKTPLMAISGYAENLQANGNPEKSGHYYEAIFSNIQYMQRLITDMLNLAQLRQSKVNLTKEAIDLRRLMEAVTADFEQEVSEKGLYLTIEGSGQMEADSQLLERAIRNLIENAVKFSPAGEALHIRLADRFIQITNTGVTLPKEMWDTVFQPFVKGDEVRERESGTGLGLAIVKDIAELHGFQCRLECGEQETTVILEG